MVLSKRRIAVGKAIETIALEHGCLLYRGSRGQARKRWLQALVPGDESHIVERLDDRAFELRHHLQIVVVLDVVALDDR